MMSESAAVYAGRGVMFTVFDTNEDIVEGPHSAPGIIAQAIHETGLLDSDESLALARHLTTSTFPQVTDRTARFNSVLKAGDVVGARLIPKLMKGLELLYSLQANAGTMYTYQLFQARTAGFAEAVAILTHPFAVESEEGSIEIDWCAVQHYTHLLQNSNPAWQKAKQVGDKNGWNDD